MKALLMAGLLSIGISAYAGEKGNGGYSIVCRSDEGLIESAELLDIYEGRIISRRNYAVNLNSVEDLIFLAKERLNLYGLFLAKLDSELVKVKSNVIFIPAGHELEPTDDAFPPIKKKGCKFEQLANFQDSGELLVSEEIFEHLDNVNKAALFLHEAIYSYRRKALGEETSVNTRKLVAQLLATNPDEKVIDKWVSDTLYRPNNKRPCGLSGSINERIESCSYVQTASPWSLTLVTRTKDLKEVWLDEEHHLLISDRLPYYADYEKALRACEDLGSEAGYIYGVGWRLPTLDEFSRKGKEYVQVLPNWTRYDKNYWFWTSSTRGRSVYIFNGQEGTISANPFRGSDSGSVRCVATMN